MGQNKSVDCLKLINSSLLTSLSEDKTITICNLETNECLKTLKGHIIVKFFFDYNHLFVNLIKEYI